MVLPKVVLSDAQHDVVIVCARKDEAAAVQNLLKKKAGAEWTLSDPSKDISLKHAVVDSNGKALRVWLSYPVGQGGDDMHTWMSQLLRARLWGEQMPQLFLMTGVCAGERGKCQLGDLMVATMAFNYAAGKDTDQGHKPGARPFGPEDKFWHRLEQTFDSLDTWLQPDNAEMFPSAPSERDVFLRYIFARDETLELDERKRKLNDDWLTRQNLPASGPVLSPPVDDRFEQVLADCKHEGSIVDLSTGLHLSDDARAAVLNDLNRYGDFPRAPKYRPPKVRFGIWGSGPAVRADTQAGSTAIFGGKMVLDGATRVSKVFHECKEQHRETIAVEMEAAAFYQELETLNPPVDFLAIKGVCDFADEHKDDSFHPYGKYLAASFALAVIRTYVSEKGFTAAPKAVLPPLGPASGWNRKIRNWLVVHTRIFLSTTDGTRHKTKGTA